MSKKSTSRERLIVFDLMRGLFILIIIIDHLQRWPGIFDWFTGQGRLWASAAEGFILISGIMIGLVRGYKSRHVPLIKVSKKVWYRAFTLYIWAILTCLLSLLLVRVWPGQITPFPPGLDSFSEGSPIYLLWQILTLQATFGWSVFLILYAVFLSLTPGALWLLRTNRWWLLLIICFGIWVVGIGKNQNLLSWQLLFFIGAILGYHYDSSRKVWHAFAHQSLVRTLVLCSAAITLAASIFTIFAWPIIKSSLSPISLENFLQYRTFIDPFFIRNEFRPAHILVTLLWFSALYIIFSRYQTVIMKKVGWILMPFGQHSLFAYIVQGFVVIALSALLPQTANMFINALIIIAGIAITWALTTKVPFLHKIIPS